MLPYYHTTILPYYHTTILPYYDIMHGADPGARDATPGVNSSRRRRDPGARARKTTEKHRTKRGATGAHRLGEAGLPLKEM